MSPILAGFALAVVCMAALAAHPTEAADATTKKRVLILGDSISMGYTPIVRELLKTSAVVVRPVENCEGTTLGVKSVEKWLQLEGGHWDVIHFNFGLHDLKRVDPKTGEASDRAQDPRQAPPEVYEKNLREIVAKLKATGAKLVWASTTPVPAGDVKPHRDPADVERYNAIAARMMKEQGVVMDDLYAFALPRLKEIQQPVNVHFTPEGYGALAGEVVVQLRKALGLPVVSTS